VQSREEALMRNQVAKVPWEDLSLADAVRELLQIKQMVGEGDSRLFEAFVVHGATDPVLRAQGYRHKAVMEGLDIEILLNYAGEIGHSDPEDAARVASRLAQAAQAEYVQRSLAGDVLPAAAPPELLLQRLADVIIAYLKNPQPVA
jgi:hypothetical protein